MQVNGSIFFIINPPIAGGGAIVKVFRVPAFNTGCRTEERRLLISLLLSAVGLPYFQIFNKSLNSSNFYLQIPYFPCSVNYNINQHNNFCM